MGWGQGHNGFGELTSFTARHASAVLYDMQVPIRDPLGRIRQKIETVQGTRIAYDYDYWPAGQLNEVKTNGVVTASYVYDPNGNRTHVDGQTVGVYDDQDRLTSYAGVSYTYTDNGDGSCKYIGKDQDVRAAERRVQKKWDTDWRLLDNNCQDYANAVSQDAGPINERIKPEGNVRIAQ